ncbi:MAG TPA: DUF4445 domain-containing protein [Thermoprotei archaeon]|nr:MAG: hypothetical protein DRJ63_00330 [Thermoprotei archaeon]HDI74380.1 DUF4445 domain-containing protein [Thermoprotei archaeon]
MPRIIIKNKGSGLICEKNSLLLDVLRRNGINIQAICGGLGLCGLCRVRVMSGAVSEPTEHEKRILGGLLSEGWRLACQTRVLGDLEIIVPEARKYILEEYRVGRKVKVSPLLKVLEITYCRQKASHTESVMSCISPYIDFKFSHTALSKIPEQLYLHGKACLLYDVESREVLDLEENDRTYGVAVDLGTTTVVAALVDLKSGSVLGVRSTYNKQIPYGNNIISRISYAIKGREYLAEISRAAIDTVEELIDNLAPVDRENIYELIVAGNTVMTALFLGISPHTLGFYPFSPPFTGMLEFKARELGLKLHKEALVKTLPVIGSYIGGDIVGDIVTSGILEDTTALLVDIGTNGEIVLKKGDSIYATSVPAGPAFEGAGLSSGMLATEGAIHRVFRSRDGIEYITIGNVEPKGICGSGYIDLLAELLRAGVITKSGRLQSKDPCVRRRRGVLEYVVCDNVVLTQKDVRKLQLAVATFKVGLHILLSKTKTSPEDLEKIYVAGSFGYHVNPYNAIEIGLLPKVDPSIVEFIGNGSLGGAVMYLISDEIRRECRDVYKKVEVLEAPLEKSFHKLFIESLAFEPVT